MVVEDTISFNSMTSKYAFYDKIISSVVFFLFSSFPGLLRPRTDSIGSHCSHRTDSSLSDDIDGAGVAGAASNIQHDRANSSDRLQSLYLDMQPGMKGKGVVYIFINSSFLMQ